MKALPRTRARLFVAAVATMVVSACVAPTSGDESVVFLGWSSQFTWLEPARVPRRTAIQTGSGVIDLGAFAGKLVVLNFWATWCAPCVKELPSLDRLQAGLAGAGVEVVAVSIDRSGILAVESFYRRLGVTHLAAYADPGQQTGHQDKANVNAAPFALYRMPITYIVAPDGRTVGYLNGAADWDSTEATKFLRGLVQRYGTK